MTPRTGPLAGLRVAEHTEQLAGTFAGHLLAGLGAGVGRSTPSGYPILDRRKRVPPPPAADVVLADERGEPAVAGDPIRCAVRAWGRAGPRTSLPPDEALLQAVTGVHTMQWSWSGRPVWLVTPVEIGRAHV